MNDKLIYKDFDRERIDRGNLTLSTAAEALRCGLVTDADYSHFESEIFDELARLITKYTREESDSVEGGTAAELLGSILYNTDLALSRLSPEAAAVVIFSVRLQNIYLKGLKINHEYVLKALSMLRKLKLTKINVMCVYYNDLVSRDLEKYIRGYDMYFDARRNYSCVDYSMPTVNRSVRGILSLIHILEELTSEADFVNAFPPEMTGELWNRYLSELAHPAGDMLSLGQLCYEHAILSLVAGSPFPTVPLSPESADRLGFFPDRSAAAEKLYVAADRLEKILAEKISSGYLKRLRGKSVPPLSAILSGGRDAVRRFAGLM